MKLLDIFKIFGQKTTVNKEDNYLPSFWEDDFCQIEIVPFENREFIAKTIGQVNELTSNSNIDFGFTKIFAREQIPVTTFSKEIRTDYFHNLLISYEFEKAESVLYDSQKTIECETGSTKAYGFHNFTIFFETENEFVKNIWISVDLIVSKRQYDLIKSVLNSLGEECEMLLVDWNVQELFDLTDKTQIDKYLNYHWK